MHKMQDVVIHPADEGNVTVILTHDYHSKHVEMMDCNTHILLNNDPTRSQEKRGWERYQFCNINLGQQQVNHLRPSKWKFIETFSHAWFTYLPTFDVYIMVDISTWRQI